MSLDDISKVPKHIAIILDGNRRFAKRLMIKPWMGHEWGFKKLEKLFEWLAELKFVKELTLYAFSVQNFNRPKEEFDYLMKIFKEMCDKYSNDKKIKENGIRINVIGRTYMFPQDLQEKIKSLMEKTKDNKDYIVNIALAYGGREEVIDATKKIAEQLKSGKLNIDQINEEIFSKNVYMSSEPDLIIRTGGDHRTSNFLIWQSSYSEWFFLEKTWPEFEKEDLIKVLDEFKTRDRRFGK
jgi:tritrans,polycis-undecaprenyl-diphosphate synthase [geranylgeranyl-diphosphate specific]